MYVCVCVCMCVYVCAVWGYCHFYQVSRISPYGHSDVLGLGRSHRSRPTVGAQSVSLCYPSTSVICTLDQNLARCPRTTLEVRVVAPWLLPGQLQGRVLLSHPRGGGVNSGTHPPRILAYPQTDKCPTTPPRGGGGLDTHPRTQLRHALQKTKFFTEVNNHHVSLIVSVAPFASSTNDKAS